MGREGQWGVMGEGSMHDRQCMWPSVRQASAGLPHAPTGHRPNWPPLPRSPSPQPGVADQHRLVGCELCGGRGRGSGDGREG